MSAPKYSVEFKEQVVLGIVQKSRPMAEVAGSYGLVAQAVGNWVAGWRKEHSDFSADAMTAEEHAEIKRLRAELREARMENEFLKKAAAFFAQESG
ncbi:MAG: transposase [Propionibacterium acidifaciens]|uniref:transposase n=1 Tax=Propionibacterium acidifaciens TaxID=556499 RepID=UPI003607824D